MSKSIASLSKMWHKVINLENTLFPALKETLRLEELSTKESKHRGSIIPLARDKAIISD